MRTCWMEPETWFARQPAGDNWYDNLCIRPDNIQLPQFVIYSRMFKLETNRGRFAGTEFRGWVASVHGEFASFLVFGTFFLLTDSGGGRETAASSLSPWDKEGEVQKGLEYHKQKGERAWINKSKCMHIPILSSASGGKIPSGEFAGQPSTQAPKMSGKHEKNKRVRHLPGPAFFEKFGVENRLWDDRSLT